MSEYKFSLKPKDVANVNTKHRRIQTKIPAPGTEEIFSKLSEVESRSMHGQLPIVWSRAENFNVFDLFENKWIDFTSTILWPTLGIQTLT